MIALPAVSSGVGWLVATCKGSPIEVRIRALWVWGSILNGGIFFFFFLFGLIDKDRSIDLKMFRYYFSVLIIILFNLLYIYIYIYIISPLLK